MFNFFSWLIVIRGVVGSLAGFVKICLFCRFSSVSRSSQPVSTWVLILRSVVLSDAGWYECQVSSMPKLSRWVQLEVVVPEVKIKGPEDMFVTAGSDVVIECVTENVISKPGFVTWVFNGKVSFLYLGI